MSEEASVVMVAAMPESSSEHPKDGALADHNMLSDSSSSFTLGKDSPHQSSSTASPSAESKDVDKIASLLQFASNGNVEEVRKILDSGMDVNDADYDGRTALHLAASDGQLGVVKLLLDRKADVNPVDRFRDTPLVNATRMMKGDSNKEKEYEDIRTLLLERGGRGKNQLGNKQSREQAQQAEELEQLNQLEQLQEDYEIDCKELGIENGKVKSGNIIGTGSYGEVYLVNWRGTKVAAKMILQRLEQKEEIKREFKMELLLLQSLRHPNIVEFLGAVTKTNPLVIVTEYLANGDLHEILLRRGRIPAKTAVAYALDIARGMNYLHQNKPKAIVHRDLKPRNLLQDEAGHLKVADFGLSKLLEPRFSQNGRDGLYHMTGGTGTYRYMAPEVFLHKKYDKSVDVFSFAIIVNEMFEGRPSQQTDPGDEVALARARSQRRPSFFAKTYPPAMKKLLKDCWHNNPKSRPKFEEIIEKLEAMQEELKNTSRWKPKPISDAVNNISRRLSNLVSNTRGSNEAGGSRRGELPTWATSEDNSPFFTDSQDESSVSGKRHPAPAAASSSTSSPQYSLYTCDNIK